MLELVGQVFAYTGIGLLVLAAGFAAMDVLTPGPLRELVMAGNVNAAIISAATLLSLGLIQWFAIFFTGAGWHGIDDAVVFGVVGVIAQVAGFLLVDAVTPDKLGAICTSERFHPAVAVTASVQFAVALIVAASLT
jgi:uncharacterized membrane protein YjfL (UPF0719 family)